jgi:hypothetical protein
MQIRDVVVQTLGPTETFVGQVAEGRYTWENGIVTLVDHDGTQLRDRKAKVYQKKLSQGEDPHVVAGRLTKQRFHDYGGGKQDFWRPLTYKTVNY